MFCNAQLPDGSIAPDWNYTDINGNDHHLYDYLDSGYTVIIDICATWCPPCYSYHQSGTLDSLWNNYGPDGTNELRVFHIEGDASTNLDDLMGIGSNTVGDYVTGVEYPIIDTADVSTLYQIGYFPTIFMICPNRQVTEVGQVPWTTVYSSTSSCVPASLPMAANIISTDEYRSGCYAAYTNDEITFQNGGLNPIISARISVSQNNSELKGINWAGNLETYQLVTLSLGYFSLNNHLDSLVYRITDLNSGDTLATYVVDIDQRHVIPNEFTLEVYTDSYADETSWVIQDSWGNVVEYYNYVNDESDSLMTHEISLPTTSDCYFFMWYDSYGDGIAGAWGNNPYGLYGMRIHQNGVIFMDYTSTDSWLYGEEKTIYMAVDETNSILEDTVQTNLYPNPFNESINIELSKTKSLKLNIYNGLGQCVFSKRYGTTSYVNVERNSLPAGLYLFEMEIDGVTSTKKVLMQDN